MKPAFGAVINVGHRLAQHVMGAWWLNEGAGNAAVDSGLYGNHGTLIPNAKRQADSILLDGISGYVNVPHSPSLMPSNQITVAVRTRNSVVPAAFDVILMKTTNAGWGDGYGFYYTGSNTV